MAEEKLLATRAGYGQGLLDIGEKYDDVTWQVTKKLKIKLHK